MERAVQLRIRGSVLTETVLHTLLAPNSGFKSVSEPSDLQSSGNYYGGLRRPLKSDIGNWIELVLQVVEGASAAATVYTVLREIARKRKTPQEPKYTSKGWLTDKSEACPSTLLRSVYTLFGTTIFQGGRHGEHTSSV